MVCYTDYVTEHAANHELVNSGAAVIDDKSQAGIVTSTSSAGHDVGKESVTLISLLKGHTSGRTAQGQHSRPAVCASKSAVRHAEGTQSLPCGSAQHSTAQQAVRMCSCESQKSSYTVCLGYELLVMQKSTAQHSRSIDVSQDRCDTPRKSCNMSGGRHSQSALMTLRTRAAQQAVRGLKCV